MPRNLTELHKRRIQALRSIAEHFDFRLHDRERPPSDRHREMLQRDISALTWAASILDELARRGTIETISATAMANDGKPRRPSGRAAEHLALINQLAYAGEPGPGTKNRDLIIARQKAMRWALHRLSELEADGGAE